MSTPWLEDVPAACFGVSLLAAAALLPAAPLLYSKHLMVAAASLLIATAMPKSRAALRTLLSPTLTNTSAHLCTHTPCTLCPQRSRRCAAPCL